MGFIGICEPSKSLHMHVLAKSVPYESVGCWMQDYTVETMASPSYTIVMDRVC